MNRGTEELLMTKKIKIKRIATLATFFVLILTVCAAQAATVCNDKNTGIESFSVDSDGKVSVTTFTPYSFDEELSLTVDQGAHRILTIIIGSPRVSEGTWIVQGNGQYPIHATLRNSKGEILSEKYIKRYGWF